LTGASETTIAKKYNQLHFWWHYINHVHNNVIYALCAKIKLHSQYFAIVDMKCCCSCWI